VTLVKALAGQNNHSKVAFGTEAGLFQRHCPGPQTRRVPEPRPIQGGAGIHGAADGPGLYELGHGLSRES
jgi:hypothetical protein